MIFGILDDSSRKERAEGTHQEAYVRDCVKQVLNGNQEAFDALVYLFRDEMYAVAWRLTRNVDDALDVLQEVFLRAYKALPSFRGRSRFSTWLHRIAVATALDYLRRERRHYEHRVYGSEGDEDEGRTSTLLEGTAAATQADEASKREIHAALQRAIAQLPARQREVIILRYYHELSLNEIAAVLHCHVGSVKCHLFRAQKRLRLLLKDLGPDAS